SVGSWYRSFGKPPPVPRSRAREKGTAFERSTLLLWQMRRREYSPVTKNLFRSVVPTCVQLSLSRQSFLNELTLIRSVGTTRILSRPSRCICHPVYLVQISSSLTRLAS